MPGHCTLTSTDFDPKSAQTLPSVQTLTIVTSVAMWERDKLRVLRLIYVYYYIYLIVNKDLLYNTGILVSSL